MRRFQFRAQTVLTLRQREEDEARTTLARARAIVERAHARVAAARNAVSDAGSAFDIASEAGSANSLLEWHRSWIARLRADVRQALVTAGAADQAAGAAAVLLGKAMQRRRVLERLRDRAWRRYCVARDRADALEMDHLATVRYAYQALEAGGTRDDHPDHNDHIHHRTNGFDGFDGRNRHDGRDGRNGRNGRNGHDQRNGHDGHEQHAVHREGEPARPRRVPQPPDHPAAAPGPHPAPGRW